VEKGNETHKLRIINKISKKWETIETILCNPQEARVCQCPIEEIEFSPVYEADILCALCSGGGKTPISTTQASSTDDDKELSKLLQLGSLHSCIIITLLTIVSP